MPQGEGVYIDRTNNVRVIGIATRHTEEQGLLRTVLFVDVVTLGTFLGGVARRDRNHLAPAPELFVFQHAPKRAPALIENRLVQPGFGGNIVPWFLHRASGRPRHVAYLQVLDADDRVVFAGLGTELVQEVVAAIGNADIEPGNAALLLLPVLRILHHARESALHASFLGRVCTVGIEWGMQRSIRERGKGGNPQVDAHVGGGRMHGVWDIQLHLEGHKPMLPLPWRWSRF